MYPSGIQMECLCLSDPPGQGEVDVLRGLREPATPEQKSVVDGCHRITALDERVGEEANRTHVARSQDEATSMDEDDGRPVLGRIAWKIDVRVWRPIRRLIPSERLLYEIWFLESVGYGS
jgi:hypothetical protein